MEVLSEVSVTLIKQIKILKPQYAELVSCIPVCSIISTRFFSTTVPFLIIILFVFLFIMYIFTYCIIFKKLLYGVHNQSLLRYHSIKFL